MSHVFVYGLGANTGTVVRALLLGVLAGLVLPVPVPVRGGGRGQAPAQYGA